MIRNFPLVKFYIIIISILCKVKLLLTFSGISTALQEALDVPWGERLSFSMRVRLWVRAASRSSLANLMRDIMASSLTFWAAWICPTISESTQETDVKIDTWEIIQSREKDTVISGSHDCLERWWTKILFLQAQRNLSFELTLPDILMSSFI